MSGEGITSAPPPGANQDWTIDQGWEAYSQAEHDVWITLYERQTRMLNGRACDEFLRGLDALDLHRADHRLPIERLRLPRHTGG